MMRIGVLETGPVATRLEPKYGPYTSFFERLLHQTDDSVSVRGWRAYDNDLPTDPQEMDGWIITGSKHGAYEDHDWIPPLESFLRAALEARVPVAGFCFGHQILAQAMGATVVKSPKGWGLGVHDYEISAALPWVSDAVDRFSSIAVHQDQVIEVPPTATRIARSEFCENAAFVYGDPTAPIALTLQPHPEFDAQFARDLIEIRKGGAFPEDVADQALAGIKKPIDTDVWSRWVLDFFKQATERRSATS